MGWRQKGIEKRNKKVSERREKKEERGS